MTAGPGVTIGLLGDVMLGRCVADALATTDPAELWSPDLRAVLGECDAVVANLECCISERGEPTTRVPGKPFFFRAPPSAVETLSAAGVRAVTLANNHALDFGPEALIDTLGLLEADGIVYAGAGQGVPAARRGAVVELPGVTLGVVSVSDHPASYAARDSEPGIAYADLARGAPEWLRAEVGRLAAAVDLVLVGPHWGPNMTVAPAGWQRSLARELLDAGASAVAGHSAHVFHGVELQGGPILYDLGDALDDYAVDRQLRNDLGILALWRPARQPLLELVGLRLDFCHTRLAQGADADWIDARLRAACEELRAEVERVSEQRFAIY